MNLIGKYNMFREIEAANNAQCHKDINREATEIVKTRWTKPCPVCGEIDYEVAATAIETNNSFVHVICGYCGVAYVMYPLSLRALESERLKEPTGENKPDGR